MNESKTHSVILISLPEANYNLSEAENIVLKKIKSPNMEKGNMTKYKYNMAWIKMGLVLN